MNATAQTAGGHASASFTAQYVRVTVVALAVGFCLVFLRGGMLLIAGAEDLDTVVSADGLSQDDLESALGRLRSYFILESFVMIALTAGAYAATIAGWGS